MTRIANFCPECGVRLGLQHLHGKERPTCPDCNFVFYFDPKVAVLAFIVQNDKVLLVQRANNPGQGKWACPAGFVEYDEAPEEAVLRELEEETGYIGQVEGLLEVFPKKDDGLADIVIVYQVGIISGDLCPADDADDAQWFTRDNLPELVFYPSQTLVGKRWRNGEI